MRPSPGNLRGVASWRGAPAAAALLLWSAPVRAQLEPPEVPPETQETIGAGDVVTPRRDLSPPAARRAESGAPAPGLTASAAPPAPTPGAATLFDRLGGEPPTLRTAGGVGELVALGMAELDWSWGRRGDTAVSEAFRVRRAQLGLAARAGVFHLVAGGEYAAAPGSAVPGARWTARVAATDLFVAVAPWGRLAQLQIGQFDAPFTLENRTRDGAIHFLERSLAVRALGAPARREVGAMLAGVVGDPLFHYSLGLFNGDGPRFGNADDQLDAIGRFFVAPLGFRHDGFLDGITVGASGWIGDRANTGAPWPQTTAGGLRFLDVAPYLTTPAGRGSATPVQLRQVGLTRAVAGEINAPLGHRLGARAEVMWRQSPLSEEEVSSAGAPAIIGGANLIGWSGYAEIWCWALGDDRILGDRHGIEPLGPSSAPRSAGDGLMIAVRVERVDEQLSLERDAALLNLHDPSVGRIRAGVAEVAVNYWQTRRLRATVDYAFTHLDGTAAQVRSLPSANIHEIGLRLTVAL